jgi:hypothetical protein
MSVAVAVAGDVDRSLSKLSKGGSWMRSRSKSGKSLGDELAGRLDSLPFSAY